jgi:hypothetical protein
MTLHASMNASHSLSRAVSIVCSSDPTRRSTRRIVDTCHRMARARLHQRRRAGRLDMSILPGSVDDLAMDCIAGLFERTDDGTFPELQQYFSDDDLDALDDTEVASQLRRLVFGAVGDRIFECYRAADPSLGRIIRTVKRTVRASDTATLQRRYGTLHVVVNNGSLTAQRLMSAARMEALLAPHVADSTCTRDLVRAGLQTVREQAAHPPHYPVSRLAQAIRGATVRVSDPEPSERDVVTLRTGRFRPETLQRMLQDAVREVRKAKRSGYVDGGKLASATYAAYFRAIETYLDAQFVPPDRPWIRHHDALAEEINGLTRDAYRDEHRSVFEYLLRQTRDAFLGRVRAEWENGARSDDKHDPSSGVQQMSSVGRR